MRTRTTCGCGRSFAVLVLVLASAGTTLMLDGRWLLKLPNSPTGEVLSAADLAISAASAESAVEGTTRTADPPPPDQAQQDDGSGIVAVRKQVGTVSGHGAGSKTSADSRSAPAPGADLTAASVASSKATAAIIEQAKLLPQQQQLQQQQQQQQLLQQQPPLAIDANSSSLTPRRSGQKVLYGFYLHVYADPPAVIYQVRQVKKHFPESPIYVMSDGGMDFSELCKKEGCTFMLCPPANDRWHPWPFFSRLHDAAATLNTEFVIMLEPDNTIHGPIKKPPEHDAGGLFVQGRGFGQREYVEGLARKRVPNYKWTSVSMSSGLCGGSYFRTEAILDALSDKNMMALDWNDLGDKGSKEIFSSDFAMQYAFAARGWSIAPWEESAQMDKDRNKPLTGRKDSAFRHYCSCYPGGKPTYNMRLEAKDKKLVKESPYAQSSVCQICYNHTRYLALWGSDKCTNKIPFHFSEKLVDRHHPELKTRACDLPWLCEPGKRIRPPKKRPGTDEHGPILPPDPTDTYILSGNGDEFCPGGSVGLRDVANCKAAAKQLGKKLVYTEAQTNYNDPSGCVYRVPDNDVYFNGVEEGAGSSGRQILCRKGLPRQG